MAGEVSYGGMRYGGLSFGKAGEASWVQLGYGAFKLRHVMAGGVRQCTVRSVMVGVGSFWLGRRVLLRNGESR